ncbi:hypothetical protein Tco_1256101 [Tanacetum coccineum]
MGLWYPKDTDFYLTAFLDLDHAGCLDSRKSTFGGIKFLGGDKLVVKEAGLQFNVFSRNRSSIPAPTNIDVRYHFIKELAEKGIVELFFVEIEYQLADIFTKALPEDRYKRRCCNSILAKSDSLSHAHAQTTKTYYKHQDSRIKKAQELKTKTFANSDIKDPSSKTKLRGRLLESFQKDAKYKHVGQDTRSQDGKDDKDKQGKYLKISKLKTKSKDNDKG